MGLRPWLWLSPALAHKCSPAALNSLTFFSRAHRPPPQWQAWDWRGLRFPNRLGLAGGVDKNAQNVDAWWSLGAGFLEVGTITPKPQLGNPPPVVDRDVPNEALWNRLGFPSHGVKKVKERLIKLKRPFKAPVFANIGKNATTALEDAHHDYIELIQELNGLVDGFVINISSPNTKGLRTLLKPERLRGFLEPILNARPPHCPPILLKLSPDLEEAELANALEVSLSLNVDGWVLTNTSQELRDGLRFPADGGVSGRPLNKRSLELLQRTVQLLGPRREGRLLVSVGGVMDAKDVEDRLQAGADLVQVYSALIFEGPYFFRKVARQVAQWQKPQ